MGYKKHPVEETVKPLLDLDGFVSLRDLGAEIERGEQLLRRWANDRNIAVMDSSVCREGAERLVRVSNKTKRVRRYGKKRKGVSPNLATQLEEAKPPVVDPTTVSLSISGKVAFRFNAICALLEVEPSDMADKLIKAYCQRATEGMVVGL